MKRFDFKNYVKSFNKKFFSKSVRAKVLPIAAIGGMVAVSAFVFSSVNFFDDDANNDRKAAAASIDFKQPRNLNATKGTQDNPFIFTEIVPKTEMSKMKYLFKELDIKNETKVFTVNKSINSTIWKEIYSTGDWIAFDETLEAKSLDYNIENRDGVVTFKNIKSCVEGWGGTNKSRYNQNPRPNGWWEPWDGWQWWRSQIKMKGTDAFIGKKGHTYKVSFKYKMSKDNVKFDYAVEALDGKKFKEPETITYDNNNRDKDGYKTYTKEFTVTNGELPNEEKARIVYGFGNSNANGDLAFTFKDVKVEEKFVVTAENNDPNNLYVTFKQIYELEKKGILSEEGSANSNSTPYTYKDNNTFITQNGYFRHVRDSFAYNGGYGDYTIDVKSDKSYTFRYVGYGLGDYIWTQDNNIPRGYSTISYNDFKNKYENDSPKIWVANQKISTSDKGDKRFTIKSNDLFRKHVLGLDTQEKRNNYYIDFYTVTPEELNSNFNTYGNDNKSIVDMSDFIYASDYSLDKANDTEIGFTQKGVANLRGAVSKRIMKNVVTKKTPLVLDYRAGEYKNTGRDSKATLKRLTAKPRAAYGFNSVHDEQELLGFIGTKMEMYRLVIYTAIYGPSRFYNYFMNDCNNTLVPAIHEATNTGIPRSNKDVPNTEEFEDFAYDERPANEEENVKNFYTMNVGDGNYERYAFSDWHFIPNYGVNGGTTLEFQNTLGIVNGNLKVGNTDNHYDYTKSVLENVYFNRENESNRGITTVGFLTDYYKDYSDKEKAFKGVLAKNYKSPLDASKGKDLSSASVYKYLLNYKNDHPINKKETFNILDVEPCNDFSESKLKLTNEGYTKAFKGDDCCNFSYTKDIAVKKRVATRYRDLFYHSLINDFYGNNVIIDKTSSEFAGDNSDFISSYDTIYFGDNVGMFNTDSSGKPIYNDSNMDGRIYSHVGDRVIGGMRMSGLLDKNNNYSIKINGSTKNVKSYLPSKSDSEQIEKHRANNATKLNDFLTGENVLTAEGYRFSGNDISKKAYTKLMDYVNGGYAVISVDKYKSCDTTTLDRTSYMYKFFNDVKSKNNVVSTSSISDGTKENDLKAAINKSKANIILYAYPKEYNRKSGSDAINYNTIENGNILHYQFEITENSPDISTFKAYLIIDSNADGNYEEKEAIKVLTNLKKNVKYNLDIGQGDSAASSLVGGVSWKLLVKKDGDANIYNKAEKQGFTCIKRKADTSKKVLKVLQIMPDTASENPKYESLFAGKPNNDANRFNMQKGTTVFNKLKDIDDFEFQIKSTTVSSYVEYFLTHQASKKVLYKPGSGDSQLENDDENKFVPDKYDIVVLGFGDKYTDIYTAYNSRFGTNIAKIDAAKKLAITNLINYIDKGKALIYTHDVMSFINQDFTNYSETDKINSQNYWPLMTKNSSYTKESNWGYSFNKYLRAKLGVDRFGVTDDKANSSESKYDKASYPIASSSVNGVYIEKQGFSNGILSYNLHDRKIAINYSEWFKKFDSANGGYNPVLRFFDASMDSSVSKSISGTDTEGLGYVGTINKYALDKNDFYSGEVKYTDKMKMVNDGQIARYPYVLNNNEKDKIFGMNTKTHSPYYQFNLDNSNAVVWYCLAGTDKSDYVSQSKLYSNSPNDARNYYGLTSVDNIYFCNIGQCEGANIGDKTEEMKMLVNTMVAAGKNQKGEEGIVIENSDGQGEDDDMGIVDVMYVYSDKNDSSQNLLSEAASSLKVDFSVYDPYNSTQMIVNIYRKDGSEWKLDSDITLKKGATNVSKGSDGYTVLKDTTYSLYLDAKKYIKNKDSSYWKITAKPVSVAVTGYENAIKVIRRNIVNMNDDK